MFSLSEISVGFLLLPRLTNMTKPAECFRNETRVAKFVDLIVSYNRTANISLPMLVSRLKFPVIGKYNFSIFCVAIKWSFFYVSTVKHKLNSFIGDPYYKTPF